MIKLAAKTHKAKNIIKRWGEDWQIVEINKSKLFIQSAKDESGDDHNLPDSVRWIEVFNDVDFLIL